MRDKRGQWVGRVATGAALVGAIVLGIWVGLGRPYLWQQSGQALPSPTPENRALATPVALPTLTPAPAVTLSPPATTLSTPLPTPLSAPMPMPTVQRAATGIGTFTSREVVTTTLAVPVAEWREGAAQSVALSADGRRLAFSAQSQNGTDDIYLYDREQEALSRVTSAPDGSPSNSWVGAPAITPDGRYLAFYAWSSNLVPDDTNAVQDLFFYDHTSAEISRISVGRQGEQANDRSGDSRRDTAPSLSADGRFVAYHSAASNLTANDDNGRTDVFVYDRQAGESVLISQGHSGRGGNGDSSHPAISLDGRYVLFQSRATNLDPTVPALEGPGAWQIYLHDRTLNSTVLISRGPDGRPGDGDSSAASISGDGRYLAFASSASNLVAGDTNQVADIFVHDRELNTTRRVSVSSSGIQANRAAWLPQITLEGRYIVFGADASNLTNGDGNNVADLFVHDQLARHTSRVSVGVSDTWTAREANGPTRGKAAMIPGGRLVAFVSQATNLSTLGATSAEGVPGLFLHERVDAPTFTLAGQVLEGEGQPVAGVVVAAGPHRTTTDAQGQFRLTTLVGGTYTLAVAKAGYTFSPPRRTVSLLRDLGDQNFVAFAGGDPTAFLDLPLFYDGSAATLLALLRDSDEGGWIDAWFDHDSPTYVQNGTMLLWDGRARTQEPYNPTLGCFERRCYEGHDGIDFPYRDPDPSTPNIFEPVLVRAAAAGVVARGSVATIVQSCDEGEQWCNGGYGNEVIVWHDNGYFTRYSHLATVLATADQRVTPELTLGEMGSTGNSFGTHLHFAVHLDNGNGLWDGDEVDLPVDPFGWSGLEADPWASGAATGATGAVSRWLWRFNPASEAILLGSEGATLHDGVGNVTVQIPAGALAGQVRVELVTGAATAPPAGSQRSLGRAFRLQVLDWLQGGNAPNAAPARPVEVSVGFAGAATRHLDLEQLLLYHWQAGGWSPLPTVVDGAAQAVIAASNQFGDFDLQAPLLCPADTLEPDDSFDAATVASGDTLLWERLFDVAEDEDWFRVDAAAGATYAVGVESTGAGVALTVEIYDRDGLTRLQQHQGNGTLTWTAADVGTYFVRVVPLAASSTGCAATYRLTISPG